ncbi:hypothetical protein THAOC_02634 [Thalassiosira oceanica]|uniref:Ammonium transporter AmtB-like domain-containing protein n=1 Tax=Thalassiosira oceanica TaxID=159749 RepID=K0TAA9_THAOC|nr:hypothetical protein THAOC_02634 [Thalassiosira oceanica]|eukprot:EJK75638.1 hypothetical protein THAOC_02634 [Thalassiosira oceanica]
MDGPGDCQYYERCLDEQQRTLWSATEGDSRGYADDATWILTSSFVIFTMQSGFGMLEAGSCSPGFEVNIMMKNIVDVVFTALSFYLVGYGIAFGEPSTPFTGVGHMPADGGYGGGGKWIVVQSVHLPTLFRSHKHNDRQRMCGHAPQVHCLHALQMGAHDFAGGAPVHLFGGINGLVATLFLGPRLGRFDGSRPISDFVPSSPASQCLGLLALWWGWIGFNCGSSFGITDQRWVVAIRCAVTTINATVGGGLTSIAYSLWRTKGRLIIPEHCINGILGSLVAITPACASTHTWDAFPIGAVGALVGLGMNTYICHCKVDDPVGAVGVHAGSGTWGLIAVGLFADSNLIGIDIIDGLFRGGGFRLLGLQLLAIVSTIGWSLMWSCSFFYVVGVAFSRDFKNPRVGLRVDRAEEERGADWYLHGIMDTEAHMQDVYEDKAPGDADEDGVDIGQSDPFGLIGNRAIERRLPDELRRSDLYIRTELMPLDVSENDEVFHDAISASSSQAGPTGEEEGALETDDVPELDASWAQKQNEVPSRRLYSGKTPMGLPSTRRLPSRGLSFSMTSNDSHLRSSTTSDNSHVRRSSIASNNPNLRSELMRSHGRRNSAQRKLEIYR